MSKADRFCGLPGPVRGAEGSAENKKCRPMPMVQTAEGAGARNSQRKPSPYDRRHLLCAHEHLGCDGGESGECFFPAQCRQGQVDARTDGGAGQRGSQRLRHLAEFAPVALGEAPQRGVELAAEKSVAASTSRISRSMSRASGVNSAAAFGSMVSGTTEPGRRRNRPVHPVFWRAPSMPASAPGCGRRRWRRATDRCDGRDAAARRRSAGRRRPARM